MSKITISDRFGGQWMEIDELANAIDYLERTDLFLEEENI